MSMKSIITVVAILFGLGSQSIYAMEKSKAQFFPEIRATVQKNSSKGIPILDAASAFSIEELRAAPKNGQATITGNGKTVLYIPDRGFAGRDQILYAATNGETEKLGIIFINVLDIEQPLPELTVTVVKNSPQQITVFNAQLPNTILNIMAGPLAGNVHIMQDGKTVRYTPNQNFIGQDYFVYEASQGKIGTIKINVEDQKHAQGRPLPATPKPMQPNLVPPAPKQPRPLPPIPVQKSREPISVEKPIELMSNEEIKTAIKQLKDRLDELAQIGAGSKLTAELTQQIATYSRILKQRMNEEKPQEKKKISVGQEAVAPQENQRKQSLSPDLMKQIQEGKQLKVEQNIKLSPSEKQKWQIMNVDQLDSEFDRINRELIRLRLSSPGASKELSKEKVERINQLEVDLNFIGNRLRELEPKE